MMPSRAEPGLPNVLSQSVLPTYWSTDDFTTTYNAGEDALVVPEENEGHLTSYSDGDPESEARAKQV